MTELEHEENTEQLAVYSWRWSQLWEAGYDSSTAEFFAETSIDLHKLCDAKKAGLTDQQAIDLFT